MAASILSKNIEMTRRVVEYAHERGVVVEAELGRLAGVEDAVKVNTKDATYTDPDQAVEFVERTGCDSLAIAIGTSHGAYKFKGKPELTSLVWKNHQHAARLSAGSARCFHRYSILC